MDSGEFIAYQQRASERARAEASRNNEKAKETAQKTVGDVVFTVDDVVGELSKPKGERRWGAVETNVTIYPDYYFDNSALKKSKEIGEPVAYVNRYDNLLHIADATKLSSPVDYKAYMDSAIGRNDFKVEQLSDALKKPSLEPSTGANAAEALQPTTQLQK